MTNATAKKKRIDLDGVLLLDKPVGLSSNDALRKAKWLLSAKKAGHTGTLDPFATGLLPLCFGEATKFSQDLLEADKTYETVVHLGVCTSTGDTEGEITATQDVNVSREHIDAVLKQFEGNIQQVPPMHSALKRDGKPLYEYARAGITLDRDARDVTIHEITCLDYAPPFLTLRVKCSKGTYIRVLGEDIGKVLGCGAHLQSLRRTEVGHLTLAHARTLPELEALPEVSRVGVVDAADSLLSTFSEVVLSEELAKRFLQGQRLPLYREALASPAVLPADPERVRVYRESDKRLLGTGVLSETGVLAPERVIASASVTDGAN